MTYFDHDAVRSQFRAFAPRDGRFLVQAIRRGFPGPYRFVATEAAFVEFVAANAGKYDLYVGAGARCEDFEGGTGGEEAIHSLGGYVIDIDARKTTNAQERDRTRRAVWEGVERVKSYFAQNGWQPPIVSDSGGGAHLWFFFPLIHLRETTSSAPSMDYRELKGKILAFLHEIAEACDLQETEDSPAFVDFRCFSVNHIFRVTSTYHVGRKVLPRVVEPFERREDPRLIEHLLALAPIEKDTRTRREAVAGERGPSIGGALWDPSVPEPMPGENMARWVPSYPLPLPELLRRLDKRRHDMEAWLRGGYGRFDNGSDAEIGLVELLVWLGFSDHLIHKTLLLAEIPSLLGGCKWRDRKPPYQEDTIAQARTDAMGNLRDEDRYFDYGEPGTVKRGSHGNMQEERFNPWFRPAYEAACERWLAEVRLLRAGQSEPAQKKPESQVFDSLRNGSWTFQHTKTDADGKPTRWIGLDDGITVFEVVRRASNAERAALIDQGYLDPSRPGVTLQTRILRLPRGRQRDALHPERHLLRGGIPAPLTLGKGRGDASNRAAWSRFKSAMAAAGVTLGDAPFFVIARCAGKQAARKRPGRAPWFTFRILPDRATAYAAAKTWNDAQAFRRFMPEEYAKSEANRIKKIGQNLRAELAGGPPLVQVNGRHTFGEGDP